MKSTKILSFCTGIAFLAGACTTSKNEAASTDTVLEEASVPLLTVKYQCDDGTVITVEYENGEDPEHTFAYVQLSPENPEKIKMTLSMSASGARYTDGKMVWWTKGRTGFLTQEDKVEEPIYDNCTELEEVVLNDLFNRGTPSIKGHLRRM